jgi:hypothetical protein
MLVYSKHLLFNMHGMIIKVLKTTGYYRLAGSKWVRYRHARPLSICFSLEPCQRTEIQTAPTHDRVPLRRTSRKVDVVIIRRYFRTDVDGSCCRLWFYRFYIASLFLFSSLSTLPFYFCYHFPFFSCLPFWAQTNAQ